MSPDETETREESFAVRRQRLAAQIARQRAELTQAYARLEQPIRYAEYGMRGFSFLRNNPWIFAAAPAAVGIIRTLWGGGEPKGRKAPPARGEAASRPSGFRKTTGTIVNGGWRLFQLYRRIRSYIP